MTNGINLDRKVKCIPQYIVTTTTKVTALLAARQYIYIQPAYNRMVT